MKIMITLPRERESMNNDCGATISISNGVVARTAKEGTQKSKEQLKS